MLFIQGCLWKVRLRENISKIDDANEATESLRSILIKEKELDVWFM